MFERYTERARRVLFFARYEASQLGSLSIDTEHLLLGLLREGKGLTSRLFARANLSLDDLLRDIESRVVFHEKTPLAQEIPFTDATKRALESAATEADRLLHNYIGTEHLLLGLLSEPDSGAGQILTGHGLRLVAVRDDIVTLLHEHPAADADHSRTAMLKARGDGLHLSLISADAPPGVTTRSGTDFFVATGSTMRALFARLLDIEDRRIDLPADLDGLQRYECALRLQRGEPSPLTRQQVLARLLRHLGVSLTREQRSLDAYVLTAPHGPTRAMRSTAGWAGGGFSFESIEFSSAVGSSTKQESPSARDGSVHSIGPLSISGATMADLVRSLEQFLEYPVVDETGLAGRFAMEVRGHYGSVDAFLTAFQDQLGLVVTRRLVNVEMVIIRGVRS